MTIKRKPSDSRERDLQLALGLHGSSVAGRTQANPKVTIAAVAREAGVSTPR